MSEPHQIVRRPVVTEKGTALKEQNKYLFEVDRRANKERLPLSTPWPCEGE
jgi:large subunit ribosomal protein L23